jgi:hypothetical protein
LRGREEERGEGERKRKEREGEGRKGSPGGRWCGALVLRR